MLKKFCYKKKEWDKLSVNIYKYLKEHSPGYVIEIYEKGKQMEYIMGNQSLIPEKIKITSKTVYDIASLTKVFTATLVYMAYEEKKLDLRQTIYEIDEHFTYLKDITILDLLSHNQNIWTNGYLGDAKTKEEFYEILYSAYVKEKIPTYVDTHYIILSTLLEKLYRKSFKEICIEKIIKKLNLDNTTFDPKSENCASNNYEHLKEKTIDNLFPGDIHDTKGRIAKKLGITTGHASLFTNGKDLLKFLKTFLDNTLLKKETIHFMLNHRDTNYENYQRLKQLVKEQDINVMYEEIVTQKIDIELPKTYNNMGTRYKNEIKKLNDVPNSASMGAITFSGYTGPMFTIDFEKQRIIVIMCNVLHNTRLTREERKKKTFEIMDSIFEYLEDYFI